MLGTAGVKKKKKEAKNTNLSASYEGQNKSYVYNFIIYDLFWK